MTWLEVGIFIGGSFVGGFIYGNRWRLRSWRYLWKPPLPPPPLWRLVVRQPVGSTAYSVAQSLTQDVLSDGYAMAQIVRGMDAQVAAEAGIVTPDRTWSVVNLDDLT